MARKRVTRDRLEELEPVPYTFIATLTDDGPLHLIVEKGVDVFAHRHGRAYYNVTKCKRVTRYPHRHKSIRGHQLCARCGDEKDFVTAVDNMKAYIAEANRKRSLDQKLKDAKFEVEMQWTNLGEQIEAMIMQDATDIIKSGTVLVPFTPDEIARLSGLLLVDVNRVNILKNPREFEERHGEIAKEMLDHLEEYR